MKLSRSPAERSCGTRCSAASASPSARRSRVQRREVEPLEHEPRALLVRAVRDHARARARRPLRAAPRAHRLRPRTSPPSPRRSPSRSSARFPSRRLADRRIARGCSRRRRGSHATASRSAVARDGIARSRPRARSHAATRCGACRCPPRFESPGVALEVGDEVRRILEADLQAHERAAGPAAAPCASPRCSPARRGSRSRPSCSRARRARSALDERRHLLVGLRGELDREEPGRAAEVALPQRVARVGGQRRVQHALHRRVLLRAGARSRARSPRAAQPHVERAHAAQRQEDVVGARVLAQVARGVAQPRPPLLVGHDRADQHVRVARRDTSSPPARRGRRHARTSGRRRPWPRCCRGSPPRRARARPARWPGSPAPRTCASRGSRGTPRACWACISAAMPAPTSGSKYVVSTPKRLSVRSQKRRVGP